MTLVRMNALDTGAGYGVEIEANASKGLLVRTSQGGNWISRIGDDGVQTTVAADWPVGNYAYGGIQQLIGGGFVVYGTIHAGIGRGVMLQAYNAAGVAVGTQITPMSEQDGNSLSGTAGYSVSPTADGGFAVTYNSDAFGATQIAVNYTQGGSAQTFNLSQASDVRLRYYDASGNALASSTLASTAAITINGASTMRQADNQYTWDSETLKGGEVVYAYYDRVQVGQDASVGGGFHAENSITVQVSGGSGSAGTPIKVQQLPYYTGNGGGTPGANTLDVGTAANVVALPGGGFAVIWTEQSYGGAGGAFDGWDTMIRYFNAGGAATSDAILLMTRSINLGNISKYIYAEALSDGRIAIAYVDGIYGVSGNGQADAYLGLIAANGQSVEVQRVNTDAATNGRYNNIYDLAVRSDDSIDVVYNDASQHGLGTNLNHTVIERFTTGNGVTGQVLGGTESAETRTGGAGDDLIAGAGGADMLNGLGGADRLEGGWGDDTLDGGAGLDLLAGGEGDDTLAGGAGADRLVGGNGQDTASYANAASAVVVSLTANSGKGSDAAGDRFAGIENVTGTGFKDVLTGNAGVNVLTGGGGADRINGRGGADTMIGGAGHDIYSVDASDDKIIEEAGGGNDTAYVSVNNYTMVANLERLVLTGNAYYAYGNNGNNILSAPGSGYHELYGGGGNDKLYGGTGGDYLWGGTGNDQFFVDNTGDRINELINEGTDTVFSSVTFSLVNTWAENVILKGGAAIDARGNDLRNVLTGNNGANLLEGGSGRDTLIGGIGNDTLSGGADRDTLTGGAGSDAFRFAGAYPAANAVDVVRDFVQGTDRIELEAYYHPNIGAGPLDPAKFLVGTNALTADQRLIYNPAKDVLYYDTDGSGAQSMVAIARFEGDIMLAASDIVLI